MAQEEGGSLPEVRARVGAAHGIPELAPKLHFYDRPALFPQNVATLQYRAPCLPHSALILDVACSTGLVAAELRARGFLQLRGANGSLGMLEQTGARGLYQRLSLCTLGQEPLSGPEVGTPSDGQVPFNAILELLCVTKPGKEQTNSSNLQNKEALEATLGRLEQAGAWDCLPPSWRWYLASLPRMASSSALSTCTESRRRPRLRK
uniref:Methyltransferase type 11 domain-containing protein n=1 Tax=Colobus angolensis palliatus TaxID=336983 RepID=A0A2K5J734_COLAP